MTTISLDEIHVAVQAHYEAIATSAKEDGCCATCDCATAYEDEIQNFPAEAISLGCGNPLALAELSPGETVLDLGSGSGLDCFVAARQVGASDKVIGVDMTPSMLDLARQNQKKLGLENVEFRHGQIEALPVEDAVVDVIISNCVINLSPDKARVFREAFRVLKPGGRLAVADIATIGSFSAEERANLDSWAACVAGAETVDDYVAAMLAAGFVEPVIRRMDEAGATTLDLADLPSSTVSPAQVFSAAITATKPRAGAANRLLEESKRYFAGVADQWDELRSGYFTEAMRDAAIAKAALPAGAVVADVGTGTGFVLAGLLPQAGALVGFDESEEMLAVARERFAGDQRVKLHLAEGEALPAEDETFAAVFANMYLHHAPDPAAAIAEMTRILKPGGKLVVTDLDRHNQEWMRTAMADRWLGFERERIQLWYEAAGLQHVEIECAAGTCDCTAPAGEDIALSVFVAIGQK